MSATRFSRCRGRVCSGAWSVLVPEYTRLGFFLGLPYLMLMNRISGISPFFPSCSSPSHRHREGKRVLVQGCTDLHSVDSLLGVEPNQPPPSRGIVSLSTERFSMLNLQSESPPDMRASAMLFHTPSSSDFPQPPVRSGVIAVPAAGRSGVFQSSIRR